MNLFTTTTHNHCNWIEDKSNRNPSCDTIRKWHRDNCKECWHCNLEFLPINFPKEETIKIPTIIKAGAVTAGVTTLSNGEKNSASKRILLLQLL